MATVGSSKRHLNITSDSSAAASTMTLGGNGVATEAYVGTQITNLIDSSPTALNTLNELAAALGDDASFSTTVTNSIATKLPLAGGTLTGTLTGTYGIFGNHLYVNQEANLTSQALQVNGFIDITDVTSTALRWYNGSTFRGGLGTNAWAMSGSDSDLSMYISGDNSFFIQTNNVTRAEFDSNGLEVTGNITVGNITKGSAGFITIGDDSNIVSIGQTNEMNFMTDVNSDQTIYFNHRGYNDASTRFRSLEIRNGKGSAIANFNGVNKATTLSGTLAATNFSGSSSGTNTGDQDLSSYLTAETFSATDVAFTVDGNDVVAGDDLVLAGGLTWTNSTKTLTSANDNTTYTAGTGLTLTGTSFSVTANTYATAAQGTTADAALPKAGGTMTGGLTISGSLSRGTYTSAANYATGADNIVLKGNAAGRSGIFFESEKDGTNINHPSDFAYIQYHAYGTLTSGEANELRIGVSNDADDHIVFNAPNTNGMKFRIGSSSTDYTVYHSGNLTPLTIGTTATTAMAGNTLSAQDLTDIGNLSGTNTGDQVLPTLSSLGALSASGTAFSLSGNDVTVGESITLAGGLSYSGTTLTSANDNTTYTAGTGLTLTGTSFSVTANTYATAAQGTKADAALPKTSLGQLGNSDVSFGATTNWANNPTPGFYKTDYVGYSGIVFMTGDVGGSTPQIGLEFAYNGNAYMHSNTDSSSWTSHQIWTENNFTSTNISNWNTAYGWGNHASAGYQTAQRAISSTPTDGATTTAISSDWAFDNVKTAVPANAVFTDTVNSFDGAYSSLTGKPTLGTAAATASSAYATSAQGTTADAALPKAGGTMTGNLTMSSATPTLKFSINGAENNSGIVWEDGDAGNPSAQAAAIKWDASSNHMRFYNNDEAAERMRINSDGTTTFLGTINASAGIGGLTLANGGISGTNYNITGVNQLEIADPGEGIVFKSGSSGDMTLAIVDDAADNILRFSGTNAKFDVDGDLTADNFSGSSSGTNTGDQTLPTLSSLGALSTTGKAADSELLDGVDSTRFVYGGNSTKTTNISNFSTALNSGFFDGSSATGAPTATWYTLLNMRHNNTTNNYGSQLAVSFYSNADMYVRTISNGTYAGWSKVYNEANLTPLTIGTTATTAMAGNTTIPSGNAVIDWTVDNDNIVIHSGNYTDTDTWVANSATAAGYVASGAGMSNKVWKTDANGNPGWDTDRDTVYTHPTSAGNKHIPTGGSAGQFLKYSASGTATWATPSYTTNTDTQLSSTDVIGMFTAGTNVAIAADGTISSTDTDTVYTHPTSAGNKHIPTGGSAGQFLKYSASGTATWATPSYTTNTNTTYSAGGGLDLTGTTFSVEPDLRDGITHVGKDSNNYIQFDSTNGRIDFYTGGVFVARMESEGNLHIKGDVIAFSNIFS
jgi:hypothetical protein